MEAVMQLIHKNTNISNTLRKKNIYTESFERKNMITIQLDLLKVLQKKERINRKKNITSLIKSCK